METTNKKTTLDSLLTAKKEDSIKNYPAEKTKLWADGILDVEKSGILDRALNIGDKVPDFTLTNAVKESVNLYQELEKGPVVLTWYRGGWCPYCNITLRYLQEKLPEFQKAGANLIALTPELPDKSLSTSEKNELDFSVLSDVDNGVAKEYGVVFELMPEVASAYQAGFGLHEVNGNESNELPLAATYVIDQTGVIQYVFLDADYRNRAEPEEVLSAVKGLK